MTPPLVLPIEPPRQPSGPDRAGVADRAREARRDRFEAHLRPPRAGESSAAAERPQGVETSRGAGPVKERQTSQAPQQPTEAPVTASADAKQAEELAAEETRKDTGSDLAGAAGIAAPVVPQPDSQPSEVAVEELATDAAVIALGQQAFAAEEGAQGDAGAGQAVPADLIPPTEAGETSSAETPAPSGTEPLGDAGTSQANLQRPTAPIASGGAETSAEASETPPPITEQPAAELAEAVEPETSQFDDAGEAGAEQTETSSEGRLDRTSTSSSQDQQRGNNESGGDPSPSEETQLQDPSTATAPQTPADPALSSTQPAVSGVEGSTEQPIALQQDTTTPQGSVGQVADNSSASKIQRNPASQQTDSTAVSVGQVAERFVRRVAGAFRAAEQNGGAVQLRLSPPELGSLQVRISIQDGAMTAKLEADNAAARTLLIDNLPALRERLAQQDIRIEKFEVDVRRDNAGGSQQQAFDDSGARSRQLRNTPDARRISVNPQAPGPGPSVPRAVRSGGLNVVA